MLDNYEINSSTLAIISLSETTSKIIEEENNYLINKNATELIDYSCKYFGSSYSGRNEGTKAIIGYNYKLPIIIDEIREIIFFPTCSPRLEECSWLSLKHIKRFEPFSKKTKLIFDNNENVILNISFRSLENQIMRSTFLENALKKRRK